MGSRRGERPRPCRHSYSSEKLSAKAREAGVVVTKHSQHSNTWHVWLGVSSQTPTRVLFLWVQPLPCGHPAATQERVGPRPRHAGGTQEPERAELHRAWTKVGTGARRAEVLHTGTVAECLAEAQRLLLARDAAERLGGNRPMPGQEVVHG